jgi:hypothetical protein
MIGNLASLKCVCVKSKVRTEIGYRIISVCIRYKQDK